MDMGYQEVAWSKRVYTIVSLLFSFIIPLTIMGIAYGLISGTINRKSKDFRGKEFFAISLGPIFKTLLAADIVNTYITVSSFLLRYLNITLHRFIHSARSTSITFDTEYGRLYRVNNAWMFPGGIQIHVMSEQGVTKTSNGVLS